MPVATSSFDPFAQVRNFLGSQDAGAQVPAWAPYQDRINQLLQVKSQAAAQQQAQALASQLAQQAGAAGWNVNVQNTGGQTQVGTGGSAYKAATAVPKGQLQQQAAQLAAQQGWTGAEWNALSDLINKESSWNPNAKNPSSTAYGLGQFLDSTWKGTGYQRSADPTTQLKAMYAYIKSRYGTPSKALQFWLSPKKNGHWY